MSNINPNSDRAYIDNISITNPTDFPHFLNAIKLEPFRSISSLDIQFWHPISIIAGTNRIGKSTILMAIACSHYKFYKRNPSNGEFIRHTWSSLMKFTHFDRQTYDWSYWVLYRRGNKSDNKRGQRKFQTNKWNGIAKKESQIMDRTVVFIDVDRISPLRNTSVRSVQVAKSLIQTKISDHNSTRIMEYLSYILEDEFVLNKIAQYQDKDIFTYHNLNTDYTNFNTASGEDTLTRILIDVVEAEKNSLILIDELEIGLHPKIQRRLVDVLYHVAKEDKKQFIVTTHSPNLYSAFNIKSRIFLEKKQDGTLRSIYNISVNAAFTKMDSTNYPLVDLFVEDDVARDIVKKTIDDIQITQKILNFDGLVNIIEVGSATDTYNCFKLHQKIYEKRKIKTGFGCILDGDQKLLKASNNSLQFPMEEGLFFLFSNDAPETFMLKQFISSQVTPNTELVYHINNTNTHALFSKMVENSLAVDKKDAFEKCWNAYMATEDGKKFINDMKHFLISLCRVYSPNL